MNTTPHGWKIFDAALPVLTYEYSFGPGSAHALAVAGAYGLIVVSPPAGVEAGVFDDLLRFGPVCALVAPNGFHHFGLQPWHQRFPEAGIYAPPSAIERLQRKTGLRDIQPLASLAPRTGPRLDVIDMPHYKSGEALVRIRSERGLVWFVTDVLLNMPKLPDHPVAKLIFRLMGNAPGLKFNNLARLVMIQDTKALKRWLVEQIDAQPPNWLIPSHGDTLALGSDPAVLRNLLTKT